mgnify:CR=1 FL=1
MHVIVLGGMARVGKTEVADILEMEAKLAGMNPKRISFSTPVKEEVMIHENLKRITQRHIVENAKS